MRTIYIMGVLMLWLSLQSCDKFLDLKPQEIRVVSTVEDYRDLLASYMALIKEVNPGQHPVLGAVFQYPLFDVSGIFPYRTGEFEYNKNSSLVYDVNLGEFKQNAVTNMTWLGTADNCWNRYYTFLGPINMIIQGLETIEGGDERMRDYVKGEALVWRAYAYFKLLQWFSPYVDNEYGIPVYLKSYEDVGNAMPKRENQTIVYKQILSDCEEVITLLERTPSTSWNYAYHPRFIHGMMASIYWYKALSAAASTNDWEQALLHAEQALLGIAFIRNQTNYTAMFDASAQKLFTDDEFYFRMVDGMNSQIANFANSYYQSSNNSSILPNPSSDFYALFREDDVRKNTFFTTKADGSIVYDKYNMKKVLIPSIFGGAVIMLYRSAESQLIKAEALFRLGRMQEAKEALDFFKRGRYEDVEASYTESDLLDEILKERKLEFYHEQDMWWLDMKRLGVRMERVINGTLHVLEPNDFRYCFPIPASEMEVNKNMVQNPGWEQIIIN